MTTPQSDPATDVAAAIARLAEQCYGLQRQLTRMEAVLTENNHVVSATISASETRMKELTDAKFVTYRTLIDSQAEKVAIALQATETAIGKAEMATSKAIDKESAANADRFASVNEFRAQLADIIRTLMPRIEAQQLLDQLALRLGELNDRVNRQEGVLHGTQNSKSNLYAALGAATALIIAVIVILNFVTSR